MDQEFTPWQPKLEVAAQELGPTLIDWEQRKVIEKRGTRINNLAWNNMSGRKYLTKGPADTHNHTQESGGVLY